MNKKVFIVVVVLVFILIFLVYNTDFKGEAVTQIEEIDIKSEVKSDKYKIDIKGMIKNPGVYEVDSSYRINDVIKIAGGLKKDANTNYINLSAKVSDEMVIWIYSNKEIKDLKLEQSSTKYMIKECNCPVVDNTACLSNKENNSGSTLNINTASESELSSLEGIGEAKAKAIVDFRNKNGKFNSIEDIKNVTGIGDSVYNKIKNYITV